MALRSGHFIVIPSFVAESVEMRALFTQHSLESKRAGVFLEHPGQGDASATSAVHRLFSLLKAEYPMEKSLNLSAQGMGKTLESYHIVDVLYRDYEFDTGTLPVPRDVLFEELKRREHAEIVQHVEFVSQTVIRVSDHRPEKIAQLALSLFTVLGVKPFEDENDHPFVVEWSNNP